MMDQLGTQDVAAWDYAKEEYLPLKDKKGAAVTQESFNSIYMMADSGARGSAAQIPAARGHARS
jgi:DNA-directed RNA polymerase subunit beta'